MQGAPSATSACECVFCIWLQRAAASDRVVLFIVGHGRGFCQGRGLSPARKIKKARNKYHSDNVSFGAAGLPLSGN
eukprot:11163926-Lingulodinium_polyedra.AAC.1